MDTRIFVYLPLYLFTYPYTYMDTRWLVRHRAQWSSAPSPGVICKASGSLSRSMVQGGRAEEIESGRRDAADGRAAGGRAAGGRAAAAVGGRGRAERAAANMGGG